MKEGKTIAIVPGSFDPMTVGHVDVVRRAAQKYDKVYVAVMINSSKQYMLTLDERVAVAIAAVDGIEGVQVISSEGMLWELCRDLSADAIVKGYRNDVDYKYEMEMAQFNSKHYPDAVTELVLASPFYQGVSSTIVRERLSGGKSIDDLLPQNAADKLQEILKAKNK